MNDSMLAEQIRTLVDVAEPVTAEVVAERPANPGPARTRTGALLAGAVVVVVVLAVGVAALTRGGADRRPTSVPTSVEVTPTTTPLPSSCVITEDSQEGCSMSPEEAGAALGFRVRRPTGIPTDWVQWSQKLRLFTDATPVGIRYGDSSGQYMQEFAGPGVDRRLPVSSCAPVIMILQTDAAPFAPAPPTWGSLELGDGRTATGIVGTERCGPEPDAPTADTTFLTWYDDGASFVLSANGISHAQALAIARSLNR